MSVSLVVDTEALGIISMTFPKNVSFQRIGLTLKTLVRATLQMHWSLIFRTYLLSLVSFLSPRIL